MPKEAGSYFRTLASLLILSLASEGLVFVATSQGYFPNLLGPVVLVAVGILPLVWYHIKILRPLVSNGASDEAVDSVYYFGFLVTLGSLAFGALGTSLARGSDVDVKQVVGQFALGLVATGYAIVARLHLSSIGRHSAESSPEQTLDKYVTGSAVLLANLETAAGALSNLSKAAIEETRRVAADTNETLSLHLQTIARDFSQRMESAFEVSLRDATKLAAVLDSIATRVGSEELVRGISELHENMQHLATGVEAFAGSATRGASATNALALASGSFAERALEAADGLQKLGAADGPMHAAAEQISKSTARIAEGALEIERAMLSLSEVAESSGGVGATLKSLKSIVVKANNSLDGLSQSVDRLATSAGAIVEMAGVLERLSSELEKSASAFPDWSEKATAVVESMAGLEARTIGAGDAFGMLPTAVKGAVDPIDRLSSASQRAEKAASEWAGQLAKGGSAVEQLIAAIDETRSFSGSMNALSESVKGLSSRVATVEEDLVRVSSRLNESLKLAAQTLDQNVSRSGEAASLFTERLTVVAQKVIDGVNGDRAR